MPHSLNKESGNEADHAFVVLNRHHFTYAVHAEDGFADIHGRNPEHRRDGRAHGRTARHIVTHHEILQRDFGTMKYRNFITNFSREIHFFYYI